jgi:hypothetical protein
MYYNKFDDGLSILSVDDDYLKPFQVNKVKLARDAHASLAVSSQYHPPKDANDDCNNDANYH